MKNQNGFAQRSASGLSKDIPPATPLPPKVSPIWFTEALLMVFFIMLGQSVFSQCPVICQNEVTVSIDNNGTATILPASILQNASLNCSGTFTVSIADTLGNNYGNQVNGTFIGTYLEATALHSGGNSCSTVLTVIDDTPPIVACIDTFIYCHINPDPSVLGYPDISDNVSPLSAITVDYSDVFTDLDCYTIQNDSTITAEIERTWTATDENGNTTTCTQHIWFLRATLDMVEFPPNFDGFEEAPLECGLDDPYDLSLTGRPTINGYNLTNAADCELVTNHTDQITSICGGEIKIVRTWFVFDICTDDTRVFAQIIRVNDTEAPILTCPTPVDYTTYTNSCVAQVYLPQATATDLCSGVNTNPTWDFGSGNGPFNGVPAGSYTVTYTAIDDCNNQSTCQMTLTVTDDDPPTPLCENEIDIVLQADGTALVYSNTFDDGSHDNCGIDRFEVRRGDDQFDEFVYFDCNDIGNDVTVDVKIFDINGLSSNCQSQAIVSDDVAPEIVCPSAINLDCGTDYNDISLTGQAFATDNCGIDDTNFTNFINLNLCGIGFVTRLWSATDLSGNIISCQQEITITDNTPMSVVFPDDILTYECGFDIDTTNTGVPILTGRDCEQLGISYTDFTFYTAYPACFKIIRNWAVIDWCAFEPNDPSGNGSWEHTQVIEVLDNEAPVITCPATLTVEITDGSSCQTFAQIPIPSVDDCSENFTITNASTYATNDGEDASGIYPMGEHAILFTAFDGCGNTDECVMTIAVVDGEPPSPVCNNGVSVTVQLNGLVTITPSLIEGGSTDNCSDYQDLIFQISPNTFSCQDQGNQTVTLTATDAFGNSSFCQTTVVVQDNLEVCGSSNTVAIAGALASESGIPLSQKLVGLSGGISIAMHSDIDGTYNFQNLPMNTDYHVKPTYNTDPANGVTTYDLVLIRKHILGVDKFDSPYKIIAADVNDSGTVTTFDLVELRKLILQVYQEFPKNNAWRFVDGGYVFPDPSNPFLEEFPEEITVSNISYDAWNLDFVGIKIGDVNGSADPENLTAADDRNEAATLEFMTTDLDLQAGQFYEIPITAKNFTNILGYQFAIEFETDYLDFSTVTTHDLHDLQQHHFNVNQAEEGLIYTSWDSPTHQNLNEDDLLFTLHFYAKQATNLEQVLRIAPTKMIAEAYAGNNSNIQPQDIDRLNINLGFEKTIQSGIELYQNKPNPTNGITNVGFYLPKEGEINFKVYTLLGQPIEHIQGKFEAGYHEITLDLQAKVQQAGVLWYELAMQDLQPKRKKIIFTN